MTALVGALRVQLGANTAQYEAGMRRAQRTARTTGQGIRRELEQAQRSATLAFRTMAGAAATFGLGVGVRNVAALVDASKQLEAQLRLATRESGNFAQAQADVRRIAAETRTGIAETAQLYATFQRNARELGISQEQAARATQTVSEAFQISGATAEEAAGGLRQFLQGLQSGTLRGEELNSVLENAPRLARLLADSLGVTIGQLRRMGSEGELTADKLIRALTERRFTEQIDAEFRELPQTFGQAMTAIMNAATVVFGAFDRGGQFSNDIASFFTQGTEGFGGMESDAEQAGIVIRSVFAGLHDMFFPMVTGADDAFGTITGWAIQLRNDIAGIAGEIQGLLNMTGNFGEDIVHFLDPGLARRIFGPRSGRNRRGFTFADRFRAGAADAELDLQLDRIERQRRGGGFSQEGGPFLTYRPITGGAPPLPGNRPARISRGGGGGGRRSAGGGRGRSGGGSRRAPAALVDIPLSESLTEITDAAPDIERLRDELTEMARQLAIPLPNIAEGLLPQADQQRLEAFARGFTQELSDGLASAIVFGESLGDTLIATIQRAAAELISSSLMQLLSGGTFGGKGGAGGVAGFIAAAIGATFGGGRAAGGPVLPGRHYIVGENGPERLFMGSSGGTVVPMGGRRGGGDIIVNQTFAPNFAGNAATREDLAVFARVVKADTIETMRAIQRRQG